MAAGNVDAAARLVERLWNLAYRQGRMSTRERWIRWLDDRAVIGKYPLLAVWASLQAGDAGRPGEAERWADVVDRWQYGDPARPEDPVTEAWAATLRATLCRHGVEQMREDADEGARKLAAQNSPAPTAVRAQGQARVYCGDPEGDPSVVRRAGQRIVPLAQHRQDAGSVGLPETRCRLAQPGRRPGP